VPENRYLSEEIQNQVRQRANYLCEYCHASEKWQYVLFTVDHVIPLSKDGKKLDRLFGEVGISNGMDWSVDKTKMFYIDTLAMKVDLFDYNNGQINNRRTLVEITDGMGYPDGMCSDSEDNIWVAFWMGSCVRGFDGKTGKQIAEIKLPVQKVTSCCFAGEKLDQLIITTAVGNPGEEMDLNQYPQAGFIFIATPGVTGKKTNLFGA
jgi:gluconolactonase